MELLKLSEPSLLFKHNQALEDPRDGLTLLGPLDEGKPYGIRAGVLGTTDGLRRFRAWVKLIQGPIFSDPEDLARPHFPGFEAAFHIPWNPVPTIEIVIPEQNIKRAIYLDDKHQRVYNTVNLFSSKIIDSIRQEDLKVDVWFVIIPDELKKYCRPKSTVEPQYKIQSESRMPVKEAKRFRDYPSLFEELNQAAEPYFYEVNFHNQLKARLLKYDAPTQILQESTIAYNEFENNSNITRRDLAKVQSAIAWNISTTTFYKAGGRPWKLGNIREGVCYIGLVFKKDEKSKDPRSSCCAAQMFLDSGDGIVFKGAMGPWHTPGKGEFHLNSISARELVTKAIDSYRKHKGQPPKELFLHGKVRFNCEEWDGFKHAVGSTTNLVGIRIRQEKHFRLFRKGTHPILRGLTYIRDKRTAYLWTKGFIPRLQTYPGREVPMPLLIDVCRGEANINTVLNDVMALTKLNYNSCIFADGNPVTLKFADAVGEILTAGPLDEIPPLPFRNYI